MGWELLGNHVSCRLSGQRSRRGRGQRSGLVFRFFRMMFEEFDPVAQMARLRDRLLSATQSPSESYPRKCYHLLGLSTPQAVHNGKAESNLRHRPGDDQVEMLLVESPHCGEQVGCGFAEALPRG